MRNLQSQVGRLRDRLAAALSGRPAPGEDLKVALESGVEQLLRAEADRAAERTVTSWRALPGGSGLLGDHQRSLETVSEAFPETARDEVRDWQGYVLDLVRSEGADKRTTARVASLGVNGVGLVVMVAVFAHTGGLTGGEVAVAGGTTALGQRVLEAIFGDAAVRALAARARDDLRERSARLLQDEESRFTLLVADASPAPGTGDALREAAQALTAARRSVAA